MMRGTSSLIYLYLFHVRFPSLELVQDRQCQTQIVTSERIVRESFRSNEWRFMDVSRSRSWDARAQNDLSQVQLSEEQAMHKLSSWLDLWVQSDMD